MVTWDRHLRLYISYKHGIVLFQKKYPYPSNLVEVSLVSPLEIPV